MEEVSASLVYSGHSVRGLSIRIVPLVRNCSLEAYNMKALVTGWQGFIGTNLVRYLLKETDWEIVGLDSETYAARPLWARQAIQHDKKNSERFKEWLGHGDIRDKHHMEEVFRVARPDIVINLAAESHVCRSIDGPMKFFETNMMGTANLLEATMMYAPKAIFHQVSTDEVFGEAESDDFFTEKTTYQPRSPYAASKASADHLVMAYHHTYNLNTRISNCSNNFGPNQHEEKLIPKTITKILKGEEVTLYGPGTQQRDWIWVDDHCSGIVKCIKNGKPGEQYLLGGNVVMENRDIVKKIAELMGETAHIRYTDDRPTDDRRYAINCRKAQVLLEWVPQRQHFEARLKETIDWYRKHGS